MNYSNYNFEYLVLFPVNQINVIFFLEIVVVLKIALTAIKMTEESKCERGMKSICNSNLIFKRIGFSTMLRSLKRKCNYKRNLTNL